MRIMWLIPNNKVEKSEIKLVQRDAENQPSSRNETERNLAVDHERAERQNTDRLNDQEYKLKTDQKPFSIQDRDFANLIEVVATPRINIKDSQTVEETRNSRGIFAELG